MLPTTPSDIFSQFYLKWLLKMVENHYIIKNLFFEQIVAS